MEKLEILAKDAEDKQNAFFEISKKDKGEIIAPKERSAKTNYNNFRN
jgi:hypothetical protein